MKGELGAAARRARKQARVAQGCTGVCKDAGSPNRPGAGIAGEETAVTACPRGPAAHRAGRPGSREFAAPLPEGLASGGALPSARQARGQEDAAW